MILLMIFRVYLKASRRLPLYIIDIFEKYLPTIEYFVHLQCPKRTLSRGNEKSKIIEPTNN